MTETVKDFARDYINGGVTKERRLIIQSEYRRITGENLRVNCSTCYIEAIFKILKHMEKQPCRYRLKKGAVLQAFGDASKFCTNDNLTDELAEWHLQHTRGAASLFAIMPEPPETDSNLEIVPAEVKAEAPAKPKQTRAKRKK